MNLPRREEVPVELALVTGLPSYTTASQPLIERTVPPLTEFIVAMKLVRREAVSILPTLVMKLPKC